MSEAPRGSYRRENAGLEFDRVSFFTDAVYAIAMTLLVVELHVPELAAAKADPAALAAAIWGERTAISAFFIAFVILGRYWLAHHGFFASLRSVDRPLISLNLLYLAMVAFSPFVVGLISQYGDNPAAFVPLAACMMAISGLELLMFLWAARHGHTREPLSPQAVRFAAVGAGTPVLVMLLSVPLSLYSTTLALLSWLLMIPLGAWIRSRTPRDAGATDNPSA